MPQHVSKLNSNNKSKLRKSNLNPRKIFQKYVDIVLVILPIIILILFAIQCSLLALILSTITIILIVFKFFITLCNKKIIPKTKQKTLGLIIFFVLLIVLSPSIIFINNLIVKTTIYNVLLPDDGRRTFSHYLNIPDTSTVFIIGNIISYNPRFPHVILSINNKNIVTVNKKNDSLFVSLQILNDKGIIAEIANNKFIINPQNKFRIKTPNEYHSKYITQRAWNYLM